MEKFQDLVARGLEYEKYIKGTQHNKDLQAGKFLGYAETTYRRIKWLIRMAQEINTETTRKIIEDLNETRNINGSYRRMRKAVNRPSPNDLLEITAKDKQERALKEAANSLSGIANILDRIKAIHPSVNREEAKQWERDLFAARSKLSAVIGRLRKFNQGENK